MAQDPVNPEDIKTRKVELVLQQLDSLPTLPAVVVRLLEDWEIGVELSEGFQLHPEQSTSAIVVHHPEAKYFNAR